MSGATARTPGHNVRTFIKILILVAGFAVGGYMGAVLAPHDFAGSIESAHGVVLIVAGTLSGLFIGGGLCLLVGD